MAAFRQVCHSSSQPVNIVLERADADPAPRAQQPANATVTYRIETREDRAPRDVVARIAIDVRRASPKDRLGGR